MTATLTAPVEALLREQVANGHFPSMDRALEAAVKTVFGRRASHALESLLDEALSPPGERGPSAFPKEVTPQRWDNRRDEP
jgi:Arc/MetJ-type ribon-helix-helix transcriptional regulator